MRRVKDHSLMRLFAVLMILPGMIAAAGEVDEQPVYTWAVVPQFTALAVHRDWTPLLRTIEDKTGIRTKLVIQESIPGFEVNFLAGKPDFAYMNPYHAVMAKRAQGYIPLIRDSNRQLTGILVVHKESPYQQVAQLHNETIAFPAPNAFAAALYMRALLLEKEGIEFKSNYTSTHSNVYRHVLLGKTEAGGGVYRTLYKQPQEVVDNLRVLYKTPSTPSHPLTAHPRVPKKVRVSVTDAIIGLSHNPASQKLLQAVLLPQPVKADYVNNYQPLEALNLEKYVVLGGK